MAVVVRLMGGLGNQMFQYAAARALAVRRRSEVGLDLSWFEIDAGYAPGPRRCFELDIFSLPAFTTVVDGWRNDPPGYRTELRRRFARPRVIRDRGPRALFRAPGDCLIVDSYFHSERYFEAIADTIRSDFTFTPPPTGRNLELGEEIASSEAISIHVRRGDYVSDPATNRFHGTRSIGYYERAVELLAERCRQPALYVFSDESDWCERNLRFEHPVTYVSHNTGEASFEDMRLMSLCRHHVIANSSFSWWGAWLNDRPDKRVVAPLNWFGDPANRPPDITPPDWVRLPD